MISFYSKNFDTIKNIDIENFPLLQKHLYERQDSKVYFDFPETVTYIIAKDEDTNVGIIGCEYCKREQGIFAYISPLEVVQAYRCKGLGALLLQHVINKVMSSNLEGVFLMCSEKLVSYYSKCGFIIEKSFLTDGHKEYVMLFKNKNI